MIKKLLLISMILSTSTFAETIDQKTRDKLLQHLKKLVPMKPNSIGTSPIPGVYTIMFDARLMYISADGRYVFDNPPLIDLTTRENITDKLSAKARQNIIKALDLKTSIIYKAKGKTKHIIHVITDVDCPYCQRLHNERDSLLENGVEIRYLFYPRAGISSQSYRTAVAIWCSDNQQKAMTDAKKIASINSRARKSGAKPRPQVSSKKCDAPIEVHMAVLHKLNLEVATPQIILESGEVIRGYLPSKKLLEAIKNG